ncbi:hypothetical protein FRC06_009258 [Ceratobasidium sp. 370]|nr:hypothetical protein FRC06_009258 [Ceratobasidium sp. 370]
MWVQDVRAYYDQARPEIVSLLEYAFDSVSEVDRVRNTRNNAGIIKVADSDFVNILLDYIRLINTAFSPERQALFSTPADQELLKRGKVLHDGLPTFHIRLNSVQKRQRQPSAPQINQPVSPVTSTHLLQPGPSAQTSTHPRSMSGSHALPMRPTQQPMVSSQPQRMHTHPIPAGKIPVQHPIPQKPQTSFVHPLSNANTVPQMAWTKPAMQQNPPSYVSPNVQQTSSVAPTGPTISIPSAPFVPVEAASAPISPMDTETAEQEFWGLSWEELEALDRSEWDSGAANRDGPVDSAHGNVLPEGGHATEIGTIPEPVPATNQHTNLQSTQSSEPPVASLVGGQSLEERIITQSPAPISENVDGQVPAQVQPASTPPIVPKEEARSPRALLSASPPPPPRTMSKLERRESLLAADVIDVEELSDDDSSISEPLALARGAPPVATSTDIIDIEDSDEEEQTEPKSLQPQADSSSQPRPLVAPPPSGLSRSRSENRASAISAPVLNQPFEGTPAPASDAIPNASSATGHPSSGAQPTPGVSIVSPSHKDRVPSAEQMQPATGQGLPQPKEGMSPSGIGNENESRDMDVDEVAGEPSIVQAGIQLPAEDLEMADGGTETAPVDSTLKPAISAGVGQTETSPVSISHESVKDANAISPEMLARIRQIAEEPLITWYTASDPSMSREVAKDKYKRMSDQEVYNLFLKIRPIIENLKVRAETTIVNAETSVESPPNNIARSSVLSRQNAGLKRSLSPHTATLAETGIPRKLTRKLALPASIVPDIQPEPSALLCALSGTLGLSNTTVEFTVSAELMASLKRWKARYLTPAGSHGELRTVELACYPPAAFYPTSEGGSLVFTPNARLRTWPNGGVLRAFINEEIRPKSQEINLYLSPPPFTRIDESLDLSEFIQEGRNTIRFLHLGGMENFVFVVQARKMAPPGATWSAVLKRLNEFTENPGYQGLLARLSQRIK